MSERSAPTEGPPRTLDALQPAPDGAAAPSYPPGPPEVVRLADAALPTRAGVVRVAAFRVGGDAAGSLAVLSGEPGRGDVPLVRLHSECLTGDALGSLRCDCGEQLERALELVAASGCGVLLYLRQEGRGIGLANKIRAYALQDAGLDTVDANVALGLPVDGREYASAAAILRHLGIRRLRLLTNNPAKCRALEQHGIRVVERVPLEVAANPANLPYLRTKATRLGHLLTLAERDEQAEQGHGTNGLAVSPRPASAAAAAGRPSVTIHYAQTLDGRIATRTGNSQWISGDGSLTLAHGLRAGHQAVMVGVGTVLVDNPRLTVRHVPGPSPRRVVVDSTLRLPLDADVLNDGAAPTLVATTARARPARVAAVRERGAEVVVADQRADGRVDLEDLLRRLAALGIGSLLVEGGGAIITSVLRGALADRLVVCIAPKVVGAGVEAVGDLDILRLSEALTFAQARFTTLGDDVIFDGHFGRPGD